MTERSLFNVACKILGLVLIMQGISSLVWAFLDSRFFERLQVSPSEASSWFYGAVYTTLGILFCARSSWITRFVFRLDGELDSRRPRNDHDD